MSKLRPAPFQANALSIVVLLQAALIISILFNIPYARQALGFVYLTFVPGYAILRLLKLKLSNVEAALFAVGLSVAFVMGEGFLLNTLGPAVGLSKPLDLNIILVLTSIFVFAALIIRRHDSYVPPKTALDLKKTAAVLLALAVIVALGIAGGLTASHSSNANSYLIFLMLASIAVLIGVLAFSKNRVPSYIYGVVVFGAALALLLHVSLFSRYIVGFDIFGEYALFSSTFDNLYWGSAYQTSYNAMLSVTVLPTTYSVVLGLDGTWLFKIVYPAIFAFVPLGLYTLFKCKMSREVAFFSAVFFISNVAFFTDLTQLGRQMVGELFYVLLLITVFSSNLKNTSKGLLFAIFSLGLIVSHYSLAYVFFASIAVVWLVAALRKRQIKAVTGSMVVLFGVMTFAWFIYTSSGAAFNNLLSSIDHVHNSLLFDFFNPASRGTQVLDAVGGSGAVTFWHFMGRFQFYIVEGLILLGFLALIIKKRRKFLHDDFNVLMLCNLVILGACIALPNFAAIFTASRFYHVALLILSPLFILGGLSALRFFTGKRVKKKVLLSVVVALVMVPFFLFQTGFVYEIVKDDSVSLPLSAYRLNPAQLAQRGVISTYDVSGAAWLAKYGDAGKPVYADVTSYSVFGYTSILNGVQLTPYINAASGSYMYLNQGNIRDGVVLQYTGGQTFNVSQIASSIEEMNTVYSSGDCEIYCMP
jgi:uncharacterized membrane protein